MKDEEEEEMEIVTFGVVGSTTFTIGLRTVSF